MNHRIFSPSVILFVLLVMVLDYSVLPMFRLGTTQPSMIYLTILYPAFNWHWTKSIPMAVLVGGLCDLVGNQPFGIVTFSLILACPLLNIAVQKIERYFLLMRLLTTFSFVFGVLLIQMFFCLLLGVSLPGFWYSLSLAFSQAIVAMCLMPLFFAIATRWFNDRSYLKQYELFN